MSSSNTYEQQKKCNMSSNNTISMLVALALLSPPLRPSLTPHRAAGWYILQLTPESRDIYIYIYIYIYII
jgi:hypothetical protein